MTNQKVDNFRRACIRITLCGLIVLGFVIWLWPKESEGEEKTYPALVNQSASFYPHITVLETVEQIAFSSDWRKETHRNVPQGGHAMVILRVGKDRTCEPLSVSVRSAQISGFLPTKIINSSSNKSPVGTYYDILVPMNLVTCKLSPYRLVEWKPKKEGLVYIRSGNKVITVQVTINGLFNGASRPFFVGLSNSFLVKGHCRSYCSREAELGQKYSSLLRYHHVTPIQAWISTPPIRNGFLDLNFGHTRGQSFWQTGGGTEQRYVNFPRLTHYEDKKAYLKALEQTIHVEGLAGRAWVYVKDEPSDISALIKELTLYRSHAPSVLTMVTTPYREDLASLIDAFSPNIAQWDKGEKGYDDKAVWPYASCMGSCGPNRAYKEDIAPAPGPEVNRPDFLIDRPASRLFDFFIKLAQAGADGGLYYHAVEGHALYRKGIDVLNDPWNFGGNGDGVLIYPGRSGEFGLSEHMALPSFRLKLIRQAIERYW
jgi:hypothetical protein